MVLYFVCLLKSPAGGAQGAAQSGPTSNARTGAIGSLGGLGSADLGSMLGGSPDASFLNQLQNPAVTQMMQMMQTYSTMNQVQ